MLLLLLLLLRTALEVTPGANCVPQGCQAPVSNFGILRSHFAELEGSDEEREAKPVDWRSSALDVASTKKGRVS